MWLERKFVSVLLQRIQSRRFLYLIMMLLVLKATILRIALEVEVEHDPRSQILNSSRKLGEWVSACDHVLSTGFSMENMQFGKLDLDVGEGLL